jgi:hypothetical protein
MELNLGFNQLTQLPSTLGNLTNLLVLNLQNNQLTELPPSIGNLTQIEALPVNNNQLSSLPPTIGKMISLKMLVMSNNQLKEIPTILTFLPHLEHLFLDHNLLKEIPTSIGKLKSLKVLIVSHNLLTDLPSSITRISSLEKLDITHNPGLKRLPSELFQAHQADLSLVGNNKWAPGQANTQKSKTIAAGPGAPAFATVRMKSSKVLESLAGKSQESPAALSSPAPPPFPGVRMTFDDPVLPKSPGRGVTLVSPRGRSVQMQLATPPDTGGVTSKAALMAAKARSRMSMLLLEVDDFLLDPEEASDGAAPAGNGAPLAPPLALPTSPGPMDTFAAAAPSGASSSRKAMAPEDPARRESARKEKKEKKHKDKGDKGQSSRPTVVPPLVPPAAPTLATASSAPALDLSTGTSVPPAGLNADDLLAEIDNWGLLSARGDISAKLPVPPAPDAPGSVREGPSSVRAAPGSARDMTKPPSVSGSGPVNASAAAEIPEDDPTLLWLSQLQQNTNDQPVSWSSKEVRPLPGQLSASVLANMSLEASDKPVSRAPIIIERSELPGANAERAKPVLHYLDDHALARLSSSLTPQPGSRGSSSGRPARASGTPSDPEKESVPRAFRQQRGSLEDGLPDSRSGSRLSRLGAGAETESGSSKPASRIADPIQPVPTPPLPAGPVPPAAPKLFAPSASKAGSGDLTISPSQDELLGIIAPQKKAAAVLNVADKKGWTALTYAVAKGNVATVESLLKVGASVHHPLPGGRTHLHLAAFEGHAALIPVLLKNGAPVEAEDDDGITPLHLAAMRGFPDCVEHLLAGKASVNQPDAEGMSALLYAAKKGSGECMQLLLKAGANVNQQAGAGGVTALMIAAMEGHAECCVLLAESGASMG